MKVSLKLFRSTGLAIAGIILLSITMVSCLKNNHDNTPTEASGLMAFNLVPDKSSVSIALNGNSISYAPLSFTNYTGGYVGINPGNRTLESYDFNSGVLMADTTQNFVKDGYYSAFVVGAAGNYRNIITVDNLDSLPSTNGNAYIRFINAIPDSTHPSVVISANGSNIFNGQAGFGMVSEFKAVSPGSVTIDISGGAGIDADRTISAEANKIYTVLFSGVANSTSTPVTIKYVTNGTLDQDGN